MMECSECQYCFFDDIDVERYCRYGKLWKLIEWEEILPEWCPINHKKSVFGVQNGVQENRAEPEKVDK